MEREGQLTSTADRTEREGARSQGDALGRGGNRGREEGKEGGREEPIGSGQAAS